MGDRFKAEVTAQIPRLRSYAIGLAGSEALADELVRQAILAAWRARSALAPGDLQAWLIGSVRAAYFESTREEPAPPPEDPDNSEGGGWRGQYAELLGSLERLSADARDALLLVTASGLSYEDAARVCGCSPETVRGRVRRAREALTRLIEEPPAADPGGA